MHYANEQLDICAVLICFDDTILAIGDLEYLSKPHGHGLGILVEDDEPIPPEYEFSDN